MLKSIGAVSNLIRAVVGLAVTAMAGLGGWVFYQTYNAHELALRAKDDEIKAKAEQIESLSQEVETKKQEIARLEAAVKLLKIDHRVAQITVLEQGTSDEGNVTTTLSFVEVDSEGRPLEQPREFTIAGDIVHVDGWVVKFGDEYVEQNDPLRGTSICLFRRLYGDFQQPSDGFPLDPVGWRPAAYSPGSEMSDLERDVWTKFWDYANDQEKAKAVGIRAAQGEGPYIKVLKGKRYRVQLRASDGLTIKPEES